jgi:LysR family transcriptional regulator, cyn operon transcriptional activator
MNLRHLRTFLCIAETGSIARAGSRLHVSQPAASRQILTLENELGVELFHRIGRRLRLTSEGEDLLRQTRRLLVEAEGLAERARTLKGGRAGLLRVGATPMAIESTLSGFLTQFRHGHPAVEVRLVEDPGLRLPTRIERGDVHFALIVPDARFRFRLLYPCHNLAIVSAKHPLARRRTLDVAELANEPLLLLQRGFGSREWFDSACALAHIRPRVYLESTAPHALIALARVGYGIAIAPSTVTVPRGVSAVPLTQDRKSTGAWLTIAWNGERALPLYAEEFLHELVDFCRYSYPCRESIRAAPALPRPEVQRRAQARKEKGPSES